MPENRDNLYALKPLLVLVVTFSLIGLPGSLSGFHLTPRIPSAVASSVANSPWYPAGPAMNTEVVDIFAGPSAELNALLAGNIDLTDTPVPPGFCTNIICPPGIVETSPVSFSANFEVEFNQANVFWGIPFQFGNSLKGIHIRQGIDHLVDRAAFASNDPNLGGNAVAIDNPVPPSDGLVSPIACGWDLFANATETGAGCAVGPTYTSGTTTIDTGGTAYHLAPACTTPPTCPGPTVWSPGPGSPDLCIAANHFIAAGIATGHNANCQLTGLNATAVANPPTFFIRNDNYPRLHLGTSMAQEICYLFTGSFTLVTTSLGTGSCSAGPGLNLLFASIVAAYDMIFTTPGKGATSPNLAWWMYTAGFGGFFPFDSLLYFTYNSVFGDAYGLPAGSPCKTTTGTTSAPNYMYICVPAFDSLSSQMEFAPCLSATGDPLPGQASVTTFGHCSNGALSAVSAGYQAEDLFGRVALTLSDYSPSSQFAYLANWSRVINAVGVGLPNYFTWLNAYSPNPAVPGTVRQGFSQPTSSLNPYLATTVWDFYILNNIYDTLYKANPLNPNQVMDWMTVSDRVVNSTQLGYTPPTGTVVSIRNILRNDNFWHDGARVTAWDVKFSLLTLALSSCPFCQFLLSTITGVSVLSTFQFDVNLNSMTPFTRLNIGSFTILPGRHWSVCGEATWDADVAAGNVPNSCMAVSSVLIGSTFDPLAAGILIGSGPWMCKNPSTGAIGGGCSSTGFQNPPPGGYYTLTRFGVGVQPASSVNGLYFRSGGDLALWIWTGDTGSPSADFVNFAQVAFCYNKPLGTTGCTHWQQGIGAPGGSAIISTVQLSEVGRFFDVNWTPPYNWITLTGIGTGPGLSLDGVPAPVLYEGSAVLNPASIVGCGQSYPVGGYDC